MNAIEAFVPPAVVKTFAAFLEFCYIARRNIITDDSLEKLNVALLRFHESRQVFSGTVRADSPSGFSLPRQHSMVHYYDHIKNFGSPNGLCSSITESKHIAAVKRPWRRSNKHAALPQMLKVNERLDKLAAARADFAARGMLVDSCLIQAIRDTFRGDSEDLMDEDMDDSDEFDKPDSPTDEEINALDHGRPLDNMNSTHTPNNTDACTLSNNHPDGDRADDDRPRSDPNLLMPPSEDDDDDDCGPVETGPLMNEVRLAYRKGQVFPP